MEKLCYVLEKKHLVLRDFFINDNERIKNRVLNTLFTSISTANHLVNLNLSNCGITICDWGRYLCFMESLSHLNLSHNSIRDDAFVQLMKCIESCYCLRHLDLSYNKFGGIKCNVLQTTLATNKGLFSLSLGGNKFDVSIWTALFHGLLQNQSLTLLDVSCCALNLTNALKLCEAFQQNNLCKTRMAGNPLPADMLQDCRQYCIDHKVVPTIEHCRYLPGAGEDGFASSLAGIAQWRLSCAKSIQESLSSLEIAAQKTAISNLQRARRDGGSATITKGAGLQCLSSHGAVSPILCILSQRAPRHRI